MKSMDRSWATARDVCNVAITLAYSRVPSEEFKWERHNTATVADIVSLLLQPCCFRKRYEKVL